MRIFIDDGTVTNSRQCRTTYFSYKVNFEESMKMVGVGDYDGAFFINPIQIDEVRRLAEMGICLPKKATNLCPKLFSGLVINKFGK